MSDLVPLADLKAFLGDTPAADDALLTLLTDSVEGLLLQETGRVDRPFAAAQLREEWYDGTGTNRLYLNYPAQLLYTVAAGSGLLTSDPEDFVDESTDISIEVGWAVGKRLLVRVDDQPFGCAGAPRWIWVRYDAQDDLPAMAKLAVMRVVAAVYRQRGAEDARSEQVGAYRGDLASVAASDPLWQSARNDLWEPSFG